MKRALLLSTYMLSTQKELCLDHLKELALLVDTYGAETVETVPVQLRKIDPSIYLGRGKLEELVEMAASLEVDLIVIDEEITPAQQRNLEQAFKKRVMDRTEVILQVFSQRAQTKEAKLQIEYAQVRYELPRLKRLWTHLSRQRGTGASGQGAYQKGEGEKQIEIDKRLLQKRADRLRKEIQEVKKDRKTQRTLRKKSGIPSFALIGYTNVGKSTLLNALTEADVFVEDKLFATLDTTTRKLTLPNHQDVLLIDTVGFIRKLPHLLVASFKSTLEESLEADILLHIVDVNSPLAIEHAETTYEVLKELKAEDKPIITLLNKVDLCEEKEKVHQLKIKYPKNVTLSALEHFGFDDLFHHMMEELKRLRQEVKVRIPQSHYHLVSDLLRQGHVKKTEYDGNDVVLFAEVSCELAGRLQKYIEV